MGVEPAEALGLASKGPVGGAAADAAEARDSAEGFDWDGSSVVAAVRIVGQAALELG